MKKILLLSVMFFGTCSAMYQNVDQSASEPAVMHNQGAEEVIDPADQSRWYHFDFVTSGWSKFTSIFHRSADVKKSSEAKEEVEEAKKEVKGPSFGSKVLSNVVVKPFNFIVVKPCTFVFGCVKATYSFVSGKVSDFYGWVKSFFIKDRSEEGMAIKEDLEPADLDGEGVQGGKKEEEPAPAF